ncbi:uncharacterized protein Dwil_GK20877 [Drosophila willistoni]|uniref:RING-type domain-containing protein n=1 Tax=Drosophila willistoni TaxID=7260 RepID=B4MJQ4_DROWI|nr:uncharacterized protein LOC6638188 [Drosophila willistoni]XP_046865460.1 uncharacterized protein LOC6638188 [Drosophila willistoni]EDW72343.1 uncharacterized protein Dwil_GK20877 [Drosophila willistoni]
MPCESCGVEFTVFRRKRACFDCRRYYCGNCIAARRCQRCAIFAQRPLLRTDLLKLKPKDLIFYLQSKHISTEGCLEKEELVGLVLAHVAQVDRSGGAASANNPQSPGRGQHNPIDSLKQSCQNFFTNLSDNISESLASFDAKSNAKPPENPGPGGPGGQPSHIFEQPRVSTREIPTYASSVNDSQRWAQQQQPQQQHQQQPVSVHVSANGSSSQSSNSNTTATSTQEAAEPAARAVSNASQPEEDDCECSDDEIIATFSSLKTDPKPTPPATQSSSNGLVPDPSPGYSKQGSTSSKVDACGADMSSQSSFEELGAIGGISDESKAATDTNSSHLDQWQVVEQSIPQETPTPSATEEILEVTMRQRGTEEGESTPSLNIEQRTVNPPMAPQRSKKVTRRRSDGYLNRRHHSSDDESPVAVSGAPALSLGLSTLSEQPEPSGGHTHRQSCQRCGKNKTNIRRHVERMRRHLENSQMSEEDIKQELQEFLTYLEQRTKSVDGSESGSHAVSPSSGEMAAGGRSSGMPITPTIEFSPTQDDHDTHWDDDEGIHVYAAPSDFEPAACIDQRFVNLEDFEDLKDLENLTVKQLKEVLMLHRVDYKGCCEKQELLDRVVRLWKTMRSTPAVEKLPTDELCKICMDAPIECVFLECGHMATCTSCGKVLNECPICRQYIVRVVRFFRA